MNPTNKPDCYLFFLFLSFLFFLPATRAQDLSFSSDPHRKKVVVIDPGHGGHDTGAVDSRGYKEKDTTLAIAKRIENILAPEFSVWLTRQGDYWIDVEKRTALANSHGADVFISLHVSGGFRHKAQGPAVFSFGTGTSSRPFLKQEGSAAGGENLLRAWDDIQLKHQVKSKFLRDLLHKNLSEKLELPDRGVYQAPLLILRGADMPAVLVEVGYMIHSGEKAPDDPSLIDNLARTISDAIVDFLDKPAVALQNKK